MITGFFGFRLRMTNLSILILAALLFSLTASAETKLFTILHFNDLHGHISSAKDGSGGIAKMASIIKNIREENSARGTETLLLFGGDAMTGTIASMEFKGEAEFHVLKLLDIDAFVPGNHEFDNGFDRLKELAAAEELPVISANIYLKGTDERIFAPFAAIGESTKIAVLGLSHKKTPTLTNPGNVAGLDFADPIQEAKKDMGELSNLSNFKVALTHIGVDNDVKLAKNVPGFFAVLGGHDHVRPSEYCRLIKKVPVCQTPANGKYLGRLDFKLKGKKARFISSELIPISADIPEDKNMAEYVSSIEARLSKKYSVKIGRATKRLSPDRQKQSVLGSLITKSMLKFAKADVAFINNGGIRTSIAKGDMTLGNIMEVLPFDNKLVTFQMTGSELKKLLFRGSDKKQVYGLQIAGIDPKDPNRSIDDNKTYKVVTIDFLTSGGDGYTILKNIKDKKVYDKFLRDVFADYVKKKKVIP